MRFGVIFSEGVWATLLHFSMVFFYQTLGYVNGLHFFTVFFLVFFEKVPGCLVTF